MAASVSAARGRRGIYPLLTVFWETGTMIRISHLSPILFLVTLLAGCDSPSPQFMRGERFEAEVEGSRFTIWRQGEAVEIYRTSPEVLPRMSEVFAKAEAAVRQTTGCGIDSGSFKGDAALMIAALDCS